MNFYGLLHSAGFHVSLPQAMNFRSSDQLLAKVRAEGISVDELADSKLPDKCLDMVAVELTTAAGYKYLAVHRRNEEGYGPCIILMSERHTQEDIRKVVETISELTQGQIIEWIGVRFDSQRKLTQRAIAEYARMYAGQQTFSSVAIQSPVYRNVPGRAYENPGIPKEKLKIT